MPPATIICKAVATLPDWVGVVERSRAEAHLLDLAQSFSTDDLKRLANHVLEVIDPDGAEQHAGEQLDAQEKKAHGKTELIMFNAGDGMSRGRFLLPTVQASMLRSVLEGLASPRRNAPNIYDRDGEHSEAASGTVTHQQKLGRAFCELIDSPKHFVQGGAPVAYRRDAPARWFGRNGDHHHDTGPAPRRPRHSVVVDR